MGKPCAQCGQPTTEGARVCTQCGAPIVTAANNAAAQTMLGFSSPFAPPPQAAPPAAPPQSIQNAPMAQTMLGFAAPAELRAPQPPAQAPAPAPTPAPKQPMVKTMLGVAIPGIAPVASTPLAAPATSMPAQPKGLASGTMLGVAMPGIAPLHAQPGAALPARQTPALPAVPIVPAPAPLMHEQAPAAPVLAHRKGFPLAIVAAVVGVLVLGGGAVLLVLSRSAPPMTATAKVSAEGKEQLHLRCESCADGTTATWQGAKTSFKGKEADLDLPAPLAIGDNRFQIAIDRPGVGRDETVKLVLPLAYRIRGDVDDIAASPPVIKVRIEADAKGHASVTVDGKPVALDPSGKATLSYDVTADEAGASDETKTIERKIPYVVEDKDHKKSSGEVVVRVAVLPLHIDAPSPPLVTDEPAVWVTGRTSKGAEVSANGSALVVAADGSFEGKVDVALGAQQITVRTAPARDTAAKIAPRTAVIDVKRVASLDPEGSALDKAASLGFDALARDPSAAMGQPIAVVGTLVETRVAHHHAVMLVDDKRGCHGDSPAMTPSHSAASHSAPPPSGPCLVRVEYGADTALRPGDNVAAYGVVGKPFTAADGKTLPEVDASLVRKAGRR